MNKRELELEQAEKLNKIALQVEQILKLLTADAVVNKDLKNTKKAKK